LPCASSPAFQANRSAGAEGIVRTSSSRAPEQLDRRVDLLGDPGRLNRVVVLQPPAKAAAAAHHVRGDVALLDAERLGDEPRPSTGSVLVVHISSLPSFQCAVRPAAPW
jgi:hypothetical protein